MASAADRYATLPNTASTVEELTQDTARTLLRAGANARVAVVSVLNTVSLGVNGVESDAQRAALLLDVERAVAAMTTVMEERAAMVLESSAVARALRDRSDVPSGTTYAAFAEASRVDDAGRPVSIPALAKKDKQVQQWLAEVGDAMAKARAVNGDEDIADLGGAGDATARFKCPILRKLIKDPHRSTVCGHQFSKEGIDGIMHGRSEIECPVQGCRKMVKRSQLEPDVAFAVEIEQFVARKQQKGAGAGGGGGGGGKGRKADAMVEEEEED
jgi:hypothetical protein